MLGAIQADAMEKKNVALTKGSVDKGKDSVFFSAGDMNPKGCDVCTARVKATSLGLKNWE